MFEEKLKQLWIDGGFATDEPQWFLVTVISIYKRKVVRVDPNTKDGPRFIRGKNEGVGENFTQAFSECLLSLEEEFDRLKNGNGNA